MLVHGCVVERLWLFQNATGDPSPLSPTLRCRPLLQWNIRNLLPPSSVDVGCQLPQCDSARCKSPHLPVALSNFTQYPATAA